MELTKKNGRDRRPQTARHPATVALTIGAIGVVFGDIGTSPLYAFRLALAQSAGGGIDRGEILGVLSLAIWALTLVVTVKYVLFLMRADNNGEGGVLSLMALAQRATSRSVLILTLGAAGAALFYGDAIITPALSVLSAVEGLQTVPGLAPIMTPSLILVITVATLIGLFAIQAHGTARVARLFGPVCIVWFIAIGALGAIHIFDEPRILAALSPSYAIVFLAGHGVTGLFVLGAVFLTVTGAEALTADMGHFGRLPIRIGWFALVFPALMLNYFGQGAFALAKLEAATRAHAPFGDADWFFLMAPDALRVGLVVIATFATVIASQAVITGAYSLTQQAIALGLLPRMSIRQTSEHHAGQIYVPVVNWLLLVGVLLLINGFRSSSAMAAAYGIAVTGTMVITTMLAFIVIWKLWRWRLAAAVAFIAPLLTLDLVFFGANILRVVAGGWVPLLVAAMIGTVIATWLKGRRLLSGATRGDAIPLADLAPVLAARPPQRVDGTAVFLSSDPVAAPVALLHNLKHNRVLH
nr:KUP/HAK/KT family potassium transporter [Sphingomonadaceae bacterium]